MIATHRFSSITSMFGQNYKIEMDTTSKKRILRFKVFSLTCVFFLFAIYIPIFLYSPMAVSKPHTAKEKINKGREVKISRNTRQRAIQYLLKNELDKVMVKGWEVNVTRNTRLYVFPDNVTTVINIKNIPSDLFLVVIVCSAPPNFEHRSAIRDTWASLSDNSTRVIFLLGITDNSTLQARILEESEMYDDIIQERFVDSYNNLTIKSVMMLKWMLQHSPARFLMKSDDDVYINLPALSKAFRPLLERDNILYGHLVCNARPIQNSTNKWYTPPYIFNKPYFPNYLSGSGYVMSQDVVPKLYRAALDTPIVHLEDVYITGICARVARVKPLYRYGFFFTRLKLIDSCDQMVFINHHLQPEDLRTSFLYINYCSLFPLDSHNETRQTAYVPKYCIFR